MKTLSEVNDKFIRTPIDTLNLIGAGGINMGTITEIYGANHSGKSAFAYQTAGNFLEDNPYGFVTILDCESSVDYVRMKYTFDIDMDRMIIRGEDPTLEGCIETIAEMIRSVDNQLIAKLTIEEAEALDIDELQKLATKNKINIKHPISTSKISGQAKTKKELILSLIYLGFIKPKDGMTPHLIIWDTIASSRPRANVDALMKDGNSGLNAGGMMMKPRIIADGLNTIQTSTFGKPITLMILNQVSLAGFGTYAGPKESSSGGNALKHVSHYRLYFKKSKAHMSEDGKDTIGTGTTVTLEKSKFSPKVNKIQLYIDDTLGGKIVPRFELPMLCKDLGLLNSAGGWLHFMFEGTKFGDNYRWTSIEYDEKIREICGELITHHYRSKFKILNITYELLGKIVGDKNIVKRLGIKLDNKKPKDKITKEHSSTINESDILDIEVNL